VPFDFLKRKKEPAPAPKKAAAKPALPQKTPTGTPVPFDGVTEEWRLIGQMYLDTRLSDALNRREALAIANVSWAPIDGSASLSPVPGLKSVDPYDFIVVLADESSRGTMSEDERAAYLAQRIAYDVALEAPPLRIMGTVHLAPGTAPEALLERTNEMFVPVVGGVAYVGDRAVSEPKVDAILVNRFYLRGVKETGRTAGSTSAARSGATPAATKKAAAKASATSKKRNNPPPGGPKSAKGKKRGGLGPRA
jgi:hypothetical protein